MVFDRIGKVVNVKRGGIRVYRRWCRHCGVLFETPIKGSTKRSCLTCKERNLRNRVGKPGINHWKKIDMGGK